MFRVKILVWHIFFLIFFLPLPAPVYAQSHDYAGSWIDYLSNPVFDPPQTAYYPTVVYDSNRFSGNGAAYYYKMWYSNGSQIGLAYSNDGKSWTDVGLLLSPNNAHHPWVVYDPGSFGGSSIYYKMWFWDTTKLYGPQKSIAYSESTNGVTWMNTQNVFGGTGNPGDWNRGSYGPATILYNPSVSNSGSDPMNYSYVMYYDGTDGFFEQIGLAYSQDGVNWTRYSTQPVLPRGGGSWGSTDTWDSSYAYPATVIKAEGKYHMWYSGGQTANSQGIGYAESTAGINWAKSTLNPIPVIGKRGPSGSWNETRNYTPAVVYDQNQFNGHGDNNYFKMWRTGRSTSGNYTIGYAVLKLPQDPPTGLNLAAILIIGLSATALGGFSLRFKKFFS